MPLLQLLMKAAQSPCPASVRSDEITVCILAFWCKFVNYRDMTTKRTIIEETVKGLPQAPGVYFFRDAAGTVLYVGKATSLKARVSQYVRGQEEKSRGVRMRRLMEDAVSVETEQTASALEALILEANLIKKYQPKYNVDQKDDKSFSYFVVTKEEFPRVVIVRQTDLIKEKFQVAAYAKGEKFGPYTSKAHMQTALKILRKIFPFHDRVEQTEKGCLAFQIGLCPGPYAGEVTVTEYKKNIRGIKLMLRGERTRLLATLTREMHAAAKKEEFEQAARTRNQIEALSHIRDVALMNRAFDEDPITRSGAETGRVECYDMSHIQGDAAVGAMVVFQDGAADKSQYRKFGIKYAQTDHDLAMMREVLARRLTHVDDWGRPDAIVLDGGPTHLAMAEELWHAMGATIPLLAVAKGPTRKKVDVYPSAVFKPAEKIVENLQLLEALREEAHRFAITFHKKRRDTNLLTS